MHALSLRSVIHVTLHLLFVHQTLKLLGFEPGEIRHRDHFFGVWRHELGENRQGRADFLSYEGFNF